MSRLNLKFVRSAYLIYNLKTTKLGYVNLMLCIHIFFCTLYFIIDL